MPTGRPGRTHGIVGTYVWGCRCDDCKLAGSRYYYKHTKEEWLAVIEAAHGTESRYRHWGCRCDECRQAANKARGERRARNPEARDRANRKRMERYYAQKQAAA